MLSLITRVVRVILVRSSLVVSVGFMAKLDNPSRMSLSLVWTAYSVANGSGMEGVSMVFHGDYKR